MEKLKFRLNPYIPLKKCGVDPISAAVGGLVTGGMGLFGTVLGIDAQEDINSQQMGFSARQNQLNRDWQSQEAQKNRDWQSQEWDKQFEMQNEQWYEQAETQFGYQLALQKQQQQYNSPAFQVARLEQAGLSPALALGQGVSGNSVGFAPAPTGSVTPTSVPVGAMASPVGNITPNLSNPYAHLGSTFKDFADAFKTFYTTGPEGKKILAQAEEALSQSGLNKLYQSAQSLKNDILNSTKDARIKQVFADLDDTMQDIWLKGISGQLKTTEIDKILADTMLIKAQEALTYAKTDQQKQETRMYFTVLKNMFDLWKKQGNAAVTSAGAAVVSANAQALMAKTDEKYKNSLIQLNQDQAALNHWDRLVRMIDENGNPNGWASRQALEKAKDVYLNSFEEQLAKQKISHYQMLQAKEILHQLRVTTDYAEMNAALGALGSIVGMGTAIASSKAALQSAGARSTNANNWGRFIDGQLNRMSPGESSFDRFNQDDYQFYMQMNGY